MSRAVPKWVETFLWLRDQPNGASWQEICKGQKINRGTWRVRHDKIEKFLQSHPESGLALPRATKEGGWRFRITNQMYNPDPTIPDIRKGQMEDNRTILSLLRRVQHEIDMAYEKAVADEPAGKRSVRAKKLLARAGRVAALIEEIEKDQGGLAVLTV